MWARNVLSADEMERYRSFSCSLWFVVAVVPLVLSAGPGKDYPGRDCGSCSSRNILYVSTYCNRERFNASRVLVSIQAAIDLSEVEFNVTAKSAGTDAVVS